MTQCVGGLSILVINQHHAGKVFRIAGDHRADIGVVELAQVLHQNRSRHAGRRHRRAHPFDRLVLRQAAVCVGVDEFHDGF